MAEVRFYMDEHVPPAVTHGLQLRAIDVTTPQTMDMLGASDEALLAYALGQKRVLFSQDDVLTAEEMRGHVEFL